ncbi:MAG: hypothetical protein WCR48_00810 [Bacteroidales bacterium]
MNDLTYMGKWKTALFDRLAVVNRARFKENVNPVAGERLRILEYALASGDGLFARTALKTESRTYTYGSAVTEYALEPNLYSLRSLFFKWSADGNPTK